MRPVSAKVPENRICSQRFVSKYLWLCRNKSIQPLSEFRRGNNSGACMNLVVDRIKPEDWLPIIEALPTDRSLRAVTLRLRKRTECLFENVNTETKLRKYNYEPAILSKFVFSGLMQNMGQMLKVNNHIETLALEGLPMLSRYTNFLLEGLAQNKTIRAISFERSYLRDDGCEMICATLKYLSNIEHINLSECELTSRCAQFIADMIKQQSICRYSEGWQESLRYRDIDPDSIHGLRRITLDRNPQIGDTGLMTIVEALKDDEWIKAIDMQTCGISDAGAEHIVRLLGNHDHMFVFDIRDNKNVSQHVLDHIRKLLGCEPEEVNSDGTMKSISTKSSIESLREKINFLELQLNREITNRKKSEALNVQLQSVLAELQKKLPNNSQMDIPNGYSLIEKNVLNKLVRRNATATNRCRNMELKPSETQLKGHVYKSLFAVRTKHTDDVIMKNNQNNLKTPKAKSNSAEETLVNLTNWSSSELFSSQSKTPDDIRLVAKSAENMNILAVKEKFMGSGDSNFWFWQA